MRKLQKTAERTFVIGDEWLYYKLYCGPKTSDEVLTNAIKPLVDELIENKVIDKWFFIRYADPKLHLRVRFHFSKPGNVYEIINSLQKTTKKFIENDLLWKTQVDTYQRELERYGYNTIELAEELFFHDSEMVVNFVDLIEGDEGEIIRWLFALRAIDSLFNDFFFDEGSKLNIMENLKEGFGREFGMNKMLKLQLDKKFRNERNLINDIFNDKYNDEDISDLISLLEHKSKKIEPVVRSILELQKNNRLEKPLHDLMGSYIHMLMNRLFKSKQRMHEMVVYDFLYRYYKSEIAKNMYKIKLEKA